MYDVPKVTDTDVKLATTRFMEIIMDEYDDDYDLDEEEIAEALRRVLEEHSKRLAA